MIKSFLLSVLREISEETSQLVLKFKNPIGKSTIIIRFQIFIKDSFGNVM